MLYDWLARHPPPRSHFPVTYHWFAVAIVHSAQACERVDAIEAHLEVRIRGRRPVALHVDEPRRRRGGGHAQRRLQRFAHDARFRVLHLYGEQQARISTGDASETNDSGLFGRCFKQLSGVPSRVLSACD